MSNILAESNTVFKNLVLQALGTIRIRFLQKSHQKNFMLVYEVSSKTNAKVQIKTERFKIES